MTIITIILSIAIITIIIASSIYLGNSFLVVFSMTTSTSLSVLSCSSWCSRNTSLCRDTHRREIETQKKDNTTVILHHFLID